MAQHAPAQAQVVPVIVKNNVKYTLRTSLPVFKIGLESRARHLHYLQALKTAQCLRDVHLSNNKNLSNFDIPIPSVDDLAIFLQAARVIHKERSKVTKLIGATVFADDQPAQNVEDQAFKNRFSRVIDVMQRDITHEFDEKKDDDTPEFNDDEQHIIEQIRKYLSNFRVLLPDEIQNLIDFRQLHPERRIMQQQTLRAEIISAFGDVVAGVEAYENGIDSYIFVLQSLDGLSGTGSEFRNKILNHIHSWGIDNMEPAHNHFAALEQLLKQSRKFGIEISSNELKTETISTLLRVKQKLPMGYIAVAVAHQFDSISTFDQMVTKFNTVSSMT